MKLALLALSLAAADPEADKLFHDANEAYLASDFDANRSSLHVRTLTVDGDLLHATARGELGLERWVPQERSPLQASAIASVKDGKIRSTPCRRTGAPSPLKTASAQMNATTRPST